MKSKVSRNLERKIDTAEKFSGGVIDTGKQFFGGVVDTGE
jgi:hypothetical protein